MLMYYILSIQTSTLNLFHVKAQHIAERKVTYTLTHMPYTHTHTSATILKMQNTKDVIT